MVAENQDVTPTTDKAVAEAEASLHALGEVPGRYRTLAADARTRAESAGSAIRDRYTEIADKLDKAADGADKRTADVTGQVNRLLGR